VKLIATALLAATGCLALSGCPAKTVQEGAASVGDATGIQCVTERDMMRQQVEAFTILEGAPPVNEAAMVPDYLHSESILMDIDAAGNVIPAPSSGCT
jgi:hypothetical protein